MAPSALLQTVAWLLVVCVVCTSALPPGVLPFLGRRFKSPQDSVLDCSPSSNGSPLPAGCRELSEMVSYGNPGERNVVEVMEGDKGATIIEDERAGTFAIRVPNQQRQRDRQLFKVKRCFFRHIYIPELDICVMPRFRYQPGALKYPGVTAHFRR